METLKNLYHNINEKMVLYKKQYDKQIILLHKEDRDDEAILMKVKSNVIDIFIKMSSFSFKIVSEEKRVDVEKFKNIVKNIDDKSKRFYSLFNHFIETIPENWEIQLKKASENGDLDGVLKEQSKLEAIEQIKEIFFVEYASIKGMEQK